MSTGRIKLIIIILWLVIGTGNIALGDIAVLNYFLTWVMGMELLLFDFVKDAIDKKQNDTKENADYKS